LCAITNSIIDLSEDEDEVLLALAESLSKFLDCVGGSKHAVHILKPLESLCVAEESAVREKVN
jgi:serine/threonine-protein phosphatase 2A regulatory subunit A